MVYGIATELANGKGPSSKPPRAKKSTKKKEVKKMAAPGNYSASVSKRANASKVTSAGSKTGKAVPKVSKGDQRASVARVKTQKGSKHVIKVPARKGQPVGMGMKGGPGLGGRNRTK